MLKLKIATLQFNSGSSESLVRFRRLQNGFQDNQKEFERLFAEASDRHLKNSRSTLRSTDEVANAVNQIVSHKGLAFLNNKLDYRMFEWNDLGWFIFGFKSRLSGFSVAFKF